MSAIVAAAAVIAAAMTLTMMVIMVIAPDIGIEFQLAVHKCLGSSVRAAGHTAVQPDTGSGQGHPGTAANAAANQNIRLQGSQHTGQSTVAAAAGIHHRGGNDLSVLNIINFKLPGMAEMLENFAVFIGNCNSHNGFSFRVYIVFTFI
jgi:hypothetical protein